MNELFSQDTLSKSVFKWQELAGKELLIRVGHYPDELGKGMHVCVFNNKENRGCVE